MSNSERTPSEPSTATIRWSRFKTGRGDQVVWLQVRASIRFQISRGTRFGWAVMLNAATLRRRGHRSRIHERQCRKSVETNRVRFCIDVPSPSLAQCRISDQNVGTPVHPPIIFIYSLITRKSSTACRQIVYKTIYFKYTRENIFSNRVLNV